MGVTEIHLAPRAAVQPPCSVPAQLQRDVLAGLCAAVSVVTVRRGRALGGMTVNSLISVSLEPPQVLVSLQSASCTCALVKEAGRFGVSILAWGQQELARSFATPGRKDFSRFAYRLAPRGSPILDGALAWLECEVRLLLVTGDHQLVLSEVTSCDVGEGQPLLYSNRAYRRLLEP
jgi:flavin reductase (DIM6/NTAB) family NADH-FMN oxidoreductase RutF